MQSLDYLWVKSKVSRPAEFQRVGEILPTVLRWLAHQPDRRALGLWLLRAGCPLVLIQRVLRRAA